MTVKYNKGIMDILMDVVKLKKKIKMCVFLQISVFFFSSPLSSKYILAWPPAPMWPWIEWSGCGKWMNRLIYEEEVLTAATHGLVCSDIKKISKVELLVVTCSVASYVIRNSTPAGFNYESSTGILRKTADTVTMPNQVMQSYFVL